MDVKRLVALLTMAAAGAFGPVELGSSAAWADSAAGEPIAVPCEGESGDLPDGVTAPVECDVNAPPKDFVAGDTNPGGVGANPSDQNWSYMNRANRLILQSNSFVCGAGWSSCSYATSGKTFLAENRIGVTWVKNEARLTTSGVRIKTASVSTNPGVTIEVYSNTFTRSLRNTNTWIADLSGVASLERAGGGLNVLSNSTACSDRFGVCGGTQASIGTYF
jgi:hypothetical protein